MHGSHGNSTPNTSDLSGLWALAADFTAPACSPASATQPQHLLQPLHHSLGQGDHDRPEVVSPLFSSAAELTDWEQVFGDLTAELNDNAPATPASTTNALLVPSSITSTISGGSSSSSRNTAPAMACMDVDFAVGLGIGSATARRSSHSNSSCHTNMEVDAAVDFATTATSTDTTSVIIGRRQRPVRSAAAAATMSARRYAAEIDMDEHSDDNDDGRSGGDDDDDDNDDDNEQEESDASDGSDEGSSRRTTPTRTGGRPQRRRRHQQKQKQSSSGPTLSRRKFPNDFWELTDEEIVAIDFKRLTVLMSDAGLSADQVSEAKARRRRLKNRQSARVCSNKKRESYIKLTEINHTLRDRVGELEAQVSGLQRDNVALKKRSAKSADASVALKANLQKALGLLAANGIAASF
eukprot:m.15020 g.15020  ORF g.15020 m.15020 type:complete len:409 (+) comp4942_c1_seq1:247-1473(+)